MPSGFAVLCFFPSSLYLVDTDWVNGYTGAAACQRMSNHCMQNLQTHFFHFSMCLLCWFGLVLLLTKIWTSQGLWVKSIRAPLFLSFSLSLFISLSLSLFLSFSLSLFLSFSLSLFLSFSLSLFLSFFLSSLLSFFLSFFLSFLLRVSQSKFYNKWGSAWALADGDRLQFGQEGEIAGCTDVCDGMVASLKKAALLCIWAARRFAGYSGYRQV